MSIVRNVYWGVIHYFIWIKASFCYVSSSFNSLTSRYRDILSFYCLLQLFSTNEHLNTWDKFFARVEVIYLSDKHKQVDVNYFQRSIETFWVSIWMFPAWIIIVKFFLIGSLLTSKWSILPWSIVQSKIFRTKRNKPFLTRFIFHKTFSITATIYSCIFRFMKIM